MDIVLNNKSYPVKATMRAWRNFEKSTGVKVTEVDANDVALIPELVYHFVIDGCAAQGMEFTMSVDDWLGLVTVSDLPQLTAVMESTMDVGSKKKKTTKKASR